MTQLFGAQPPPRDPEALARAILAGSRFRVRVSAPAARTWWDTLRDWIGAQWNRLMDAFAHHVHFGRSTGVAIGDIIIAMLVAIVAIAGTRLLLSIVRESGQTHSAPRALPSHADAAALYGAAQSAAQNGRYAGAVALLFQAALAALDARGVLRDDPARTVNECRKDVRLHAPSIAGQFDVIARAFTGAIYAEDRVDVQAWAMVERAYSLVLAEHGDG